MSISALFGEEEVVINEHEVAWKGRDWGAVKKLADSFKTESANEFYDILNRINTNKSRVSVDTYENYNQYNVNSSLSRHIDCVTHAYHMNLLGDELSDQMHFDYLLHSVRPANRYGGVKDIADPIEEMCHKVFMKCIGIMFKVDVDRAAEYFETMTIKEETDRISILRKMSVKIATEALVKEVCPYAKKGDITKALRAINEWAK